METKQKQPKRWTTKAIIKTAIVICTIIMNMIVSAVTFFVGPLNSNLLAGLLVANSSALSLYRNPTPIESFIDTYMTDSKSFSVKLGEISEFLKDVHSVQDQLETFQPQGNEPIEREIHPTKTPRFKANYNPNSNTIEISQILESPRSETVIITPHSNNSDRENEE